jgi:hypothetical protein
MYVRPRMEVEDKVILQLGPWTFLLSLDPILCLGQSTENPLRKYPLHLFCY